MSTKKPSLFVRPGQAWSDLVDQVTKERGEVWWFDEHGVFRTMKKTDDASPTLPTPEKEE